MANTEGNEPNWSDEADAVYVATTASIDDLKNHSQKMNLLLNLVRYVTMTEVARTIQAETKGTDVHVFVEASILTEGMGHLLKEFIGHLRAMPRRMLAIMHAENGCGGCSACKEAKQQAYADGKVVFRPSSESQEAINAIINTITGGKRPN